MRIAISCDVLGEENNGTSIAAMNLIRSLRSKGHEVRIICCDKNRMGQEGYYIVPTRSFGIFNEYVTRNGVALAKPDERIIKEALTGADIVHIMLPFSLGQYTARMAVKMGIPVSGGFHTQAENFTSHIFMKDFGLMNRITYHYFYNRLYCRCDCIHYPTWFIRDLFEHIIGPTNGYVISNGVNKSFVKREAVRPGQFKDRFVILFTGRYSKEKSHKVLIDAVSKSKYADRIQLIFAGTGPLKGLLKMYSRRKLKIMPVFRLFSREALINVINYADLYVHPAEIEIEAIACLEAIACGIVPVIANSKRCATKAFAIGENNLFKNRNSTDLARKIDYWMEHPKEKAECSRRYQGYAKSFDQDQCMDAMENMFLATISGRKKENTVGREPRN